MFQNNTDEEHTDYTNENMETIIGTSVKLEGDFVTEGSAVIYGEVAGTVEVSGDLHIGETAFLKANVAAQNIVMAGKVHGNVVAREKLTLKNSAEQQGDIKAARLEINEGATFNGSCSMDLSVSEPVQEEDQEEQE